ncbi:hypothetical protein HDU92_007549 [Lobulomyces angularis]|nr:hypothetical protein HDU92_007549 [Lobulomyces angularis]
MLSFISTLLPNPFKYSKKHIQNTLPIEVFITVSKQLEWKDILALQQTCKLFRSSILFNSKQAVTLLKDSTINNMFKKRICDSLNPYSIKLPLTSEFLHLCCTVGSKELVRYLIFKKVPKWNQVFTRWWQTNPDDRTEVEPSLLETACKYADYEVVKMLLIAGTEATNETIMKASENGSYEIVKLLLQDGQPNPSVFDNYCVKYATRNRHYKVMELLFSDERVDPTSNHNWAMKWACTFGYAELVRFLLSHPKVNPSAEYNEAVNLALDNHKDDIVEMLLADERVASFDAVEVEAAGPSNIQDASSTDSDSSGSTEEVMPLLNNESMEGQRNVSENNENHTMEGNADINFLQVDFGPEFNMEGFEVGNAPLIEETTDNRQNLGNDVARNDDVQEIIEVIEEIEIIEEIGGATF